MAKISGAFLRRSELFENESLYSYLIRTAAANHYDDFVTFKSVLYERIAEFDAYDKLPNLSSWGAFQAIESLCLLPANRLWIATINRFAPLINKSANEQAEKPTTYERTSPVAIRENCRRRHHVAFCPICLQENPIYRLSWYLFGVTACLDHQCILVDACPQCGTALTEDNVVSCLCPKCTYDLRNSKPVSISADPDSLSVQSILLRLYFGAGQDESCGFPNVPARALCWLYNGLLHAANLKKQWKFLHPFPECKIRKEIIGYTNWANNVLYNHRLNVTVVKALIGWPNGFYRFLDAYREGESCPNLKFSLGLGFLYHGWIDKNWNTPEFEFIQTAYNNYLLMRQPIHYPGCERNERRTRYPELSNQLTYMTVSAAAKKMGTTTKPIIYLAKQGVIQSIDRRAGRGGIMVSRNDIESLSKQWDQSVYLTNAAKLLGTNEQVCLALIARGYLKAVRGPNIDGSSICLITIDSIQKLQQTLGSLVGRMEREGYVPFPKLLKNLIPWNIKRVDLLETVLNGVIVPILSPNASLSLNNLQFSPNAHRQLKEAILQKNHWVTFRQFAKIMKVKPLILNRWIQSKLVSSILLCRNTRIFTQEDVETFQKNYLTSQQASLILGVGELTVQKWARVGRLHPVSGKEIDGCHEYRFARSEIETLSKEKRLTAPQLAKQLGISRTQMSVWIHQGKVHPISGPGIDGSKHYLFVAS